jgi:hypothetical protein
VAPIQALRYDPLDQLGNLLARHVIASPPLLLAGPTTLV